MGDAQLYSETFTLTDINDHKYDRVSRLKGNTDNGDTELTLDVNTELYPCSVGERLSIVLASTLSLDGSKDDVKGWRSAGRGDQTLADDFDYVCHGKIYRFEEGDDENMSVESAASLFVESDENFATVRSTSPLGVYSCICRARTGNLQHCESTMSIS